MRHLFFNGKLHCGQLSQTHFIYALWNIIQFITAYQHFILQTHSFNIYKNIYTMLKENIFVGFFAEVSHY